jgi:MFS family permease
MTRGLRWYLLSTGLFLVPGGIQMVLFPWLVAVYLQESPARVGIAQMSLQLPMLLLILLGGLVGDRFDQRRLLVGLHLGMIGPPLAMAALVQADLIVYEVLLGWAVIGGSFGAFAQPARDALLNRVAGGDVQGVVTLAIGVQFGVQIIGFALGSTADSLGPLWLFLAQALLMGAAAVATSRIPPPPPGGARERRPALREIGEGIVMAWRSEAIRPAVLLTFAQGVFFAGAYLVILPLMVRDLYGGGAGGIAGAFAANMLGTCTVVFFLRRRGGIDRPGRALGLWGVFGVCALSLLHFELPIWGFYAVIYLWGTCGGVSMTMSRSIVQEASPPSHRARLMSVYSLGLLGGMPFGSAFLGWCVGVLGARNAVLVPVFGMAVVQLLIFTTSRLWLVERQRGRHEDEEPLMHAAD